MAFDFRKAQRELYLPARSPAIVDVPPMRFIAVRGTGDPNREGGDYQRALAMLYAVAYAIRMSKHGARRIEGFFDYVVPPLEGFWRLPGSAAFDPARKAEFEWLSCIRVPDFVAAEDVEWARGEAARRKGLDCGAVQMLAITEGLCAQVMHVGSYDDEPATLVALHAFIRAQGCRTDDSDARRHHEIYLSDPRRAAPEALKTVIRLPIRRLDGE